MKLTFLGHAAVRLQGQGHEVLVDPFLTDNPAAGAGADELEPSVVVLTHAHGDHLGDTIAIAQRSGAVVASSPETVNRLGGDGVQVRSMNVGGGFDFPFGRVTFTPAWHSNSFPDGSYAGMPMGSVIELDGVRIYHAGDTALFSDMSLIGRRGIDVALLPIGDTFTMGPYDAVEAVRLLAPKLVVPIHYGTWDLIAQDPNAFADAVHRATDASCQVLAPGQALEL